MILHQRPGILAQLVIELAGHPSVLAALEAGAPLPDGTALVLSRRGRLFELNATAACVWEMLEPGVTADELAEGLQHRFVVDAATARRDVDRVLAALTEQGFVQSAVPVEDGTAPNL